MKAVKAVSYAGIAHAVAKRTCPVCNALKDFQSVLIETAQAQEARHLCNYHGWLLAKSAQADVAGEVFRNLLHQWRQANTVAASRCDFCEHIRSEEQAALAELAQQFENPSVAELMQERGTICLAHGRELSSQLPAHLQAILARIIARAAHDLDQELRTFVTNAHTGEHTGGGILGHAAEFLFSQRGIPREEAPCSNRDWQRK